MTKFVAKTKGEIEAIVERYGASEFVSGWDADKAAIGFTIVGRRIRFILPMPSRDDESFTTMTDRYGYKKFRAATAATAAWEQACRQRWRALLLVIKAKLEAVETGISTIENEFMANIVLPNGRLVGDEVRPAIASAYATGDMPNMLPDYSG